MTETDFPADVVDAVCRHMNDDHGDDALLICRTLGRVPQATAARTIGFDRSGLQLLTSGPDGEKRVQVPWPIPVAERPDVRRAVVALYDQACAAAGVEPRPH